ELADRMRPMRPETKIMYMSGFPGEVIGKHGVLVSGAFVQKPFTSSGLVEKVREVFGEYPAPATGLR
ncbi:MAG TPA: response regulator, partial [Candidatus Dormibacteraeota bacterium]|nr:response regulator [Candidatus Dormibacteraeota bacterium]